LSGGHSQASEVQAGAAGRRVLVLRPEPDAGRTAGKLAEQGFAPIIAPLFAVADADEAPPAGPFDAALVTSAHGAERLGAGASLALPVFAIGAQTARVAAEAGFSEIHIADGDRHSLVELVAGTLPAGASLIAALGRDRHEDWIGELTRRGYRIVIWTAYEAGALSALPEAAREALEGEGHGPGGLSSGLAILHFSQRGAETFLGLADAAGLGAEARAARHVAISAEVAATLVAAGAGDVAIAREPTQGAVLAALSQPPADIDRAGASRQDVAKISKDDGRPGGMTAKDERVAGKSVTGNSVTGKSKHRQESAPRQPATQEPASQDADAIIAPGSTGPVAETVADGPAARPPADVEPAAEPISPLPPPARRSGPGWGGLIVAGILGGVVGAGGLFEAQKYLTPPVPSAAPPAANPAAAATSAEMDGRIAALERALAGLAPKSDVQAAATRATEAAELAGRLRGDLAAAQQRIEALASRPAVAAPVSGPVAAPAGADPAALAALAERVARGDAAAREAGESLKAAIARLGALEAGLKPLAGARSQSSAAAHLLLAERIRMALDKGEAFAGDVAALKASGVADAALQPLAALAEKGAQTREALRAELRRQRRALAEDSAAQPAGLGDRLLALAGRIVSVQRVDGGASQTPAGLVEKIDASLAAGDFAAAAAAWKALPEPARRASEAFGKALGERVAADAALASLGQSAVRALQARQE
jgi:uroporphyrinogen-III synthase